MRRQGERECGVDESSNYSLKGRTTRMTDFIRPKQRDEMKAPCNKSCNYFLEGEKMWRARENWVMFAEASIFALE